LQGQLRGRTFSAPRKSMKGKGRVTVQFGCCYNYAVDREGRQPGEIPSTESKSESSGFQPLCPICWPSACVNLLGLPPEISYSILAVQGLPEPIRSWYALPACFVILNDEIGCGLLGAGIIAEEVVEPMPLMLKALVHRLVRWGVLPTSKAPDSAIINIYDEVHRHPNLPILLVAGTGIFFATCLLACAFLHVLFLLLVCRHLQLSLCVRTPHLIERVVKRALDKYLWVTIDMHA